MPDDYKGMEFLGADNSLLQQDPTTGKPFHMAMDTADAGRPSLSGPTPGSKAKGIGGTVVSADRPAPQAHQPAMSPAQMMILADQMEQDVLDKTRAAENPYGSSLEGHIDRGNSVQGNVPDWLTEYMSTQPHTDPYHQVPMSGLDAIKQNKYLSEQERLKYMRSLRKN